MNKIIISVESTTYAIKLRKLLMRDGIRSKLVITEGDRGCTKGVEIDESDLLESVVIMKTNGINYKVQKYRL